MNATATKTERFSSQLVVISFLGFLVSPRDLIGQFCSTEQKSSFFSLTVISQRLLPEISDTEDTFTESVLNI